MKKSAFTLIELLVVIAIIAILSAILFPVFSRAKEAAVKTRAIAQFRQLGMTVLLYAGDHDDYFVPATNYDVPATDPGRVWPPLVLPYAKNQEIFVAPGTDAKFASDWANRGNVSVGYNGATALDSTGCIAGQPNPLGCEGFTTAVNFSFTEESSKVALFAVTPNGPIANKYRGYSFSPYNGPEHPTDKRLSVPLVSDRDLVLELSSLSPSQLKPVYCRYQKTGNDDGVTPVIFADGHAKVFTAKAINSFGTGIQWRFR